MRDFDVRDMLDALQAQPVLEVVKRERLASQVLAVHASIANLASGEYAGILCSTCNCKCNCYASALSLAEIAQRSAILACDVLEEGTSTAAFAALLVAQRLQLSFRSKPARERKMRARSCIAILVACVIYSGDDGSRWSGGNNEVEAVPAGIQYGPRAARTFAAPRFVQRAVWVDEGTNVASPPAGTCQEFFAVCADCARNVAAIESLDPCLRANRRIAF